MGLTRTAIQRPLATVMIFLALILLGQQAYSRMKVDRYPAMSFPTVFVQIGWPGNGCAPLGHANHHLRRCAARALPSRARADPS